MKKIILSIFLVSSCGIFEPTSDWIGWSSYYSGKWNIASEMIKVFEVENSTSERISYTLVDSLEVINEQSWNFISLSDYKIMNDLDDKGLYIGICENDSTSIKPSTIAIDTLSFDSLFADCPDLSPSTNECTKITNANSVLLITPDSTESLIVATNSIYNNASESIYFPYSIQGLRNLESYPENIFSFELFTPDINVSNPFINDCAISNKFTRISSDSSLVTIERRCKYRTEHIDSQLYTDYNNELEIYYKWRQNCVRTPYVSFWNNPEYNDENFNCDEYPKYPCEYLSQPLYPKYRYIKHNIIIKKESE